VPTFVVSGALLAYFFLFGRGQELFLDRLQYGLLHSHADLRWQLYSDTLGMLQQHWLLGVGLGGWAYWYPRFADPRMSGIDPVYLHSDPYQIMVESGLLGTAILLITAGLVARTVIRAVRSSHGMHVSILIGATSGVAALLVASLVDFPFRIPAIASAFVAHLTIISFYSDKHTPSDSSQETIFEPTRPA
jgi:O-antigen ligase